MNKKTTRNSFLLLVTAAVWGAAFVAQTVGGQTIGAYSFNCVRCIIGVLVLIPVMKFLDKKDLSPRKPKTKEDYKLLIKGGILNYEFRSCIFSSIWLVDSWTEAECKRDAGLLSDFCSNHFSAAAGTAKSKISR